MTTEEHIQWILNQARQKSTSAEREAFLDGACGADAQLRARVEQLRAEDESGSRGAPDALKDARTVLVEPAPLDKSGTTIGRYKLLEKIGEGGFGVVYVAEQKEPVKRRVALKLIKLGMDTRQVVARFEAERQALAMMDHPNIARVLDAGATDVGSPFFVMELVRGVPITEYCDQNSLSTEQRLKLFLPVCHAVQHAHQKGIIHRDLKPSNILVALHDGAPVPKVIDFGIAKAMHGELTDKTVYTQFQQFIGTPAYISPEQAEMGSLDIDTRADIYSLGVLLYELLTGRTPFESKELVEAGLDEMRRLLREKEPARPSTRLSKMTAEELTTTAKRRGAEGPKLIKVLRGDLDWVVMKCLEKDRTRRYETANALATDLERHLNNEAVAARPPSSLYRFEKLVRRHKVAFTSLAAVIGALLLGCCVATVGLVQALRAKAKETVERQRAERESYYSGVALAKNYIDTGSMDRAQDVLLACPPEYRNWEWGHCLYLCNQEMLTLTGHVASALAFSTNNNLLLIQHSGGAACVHELATGRELQSWGSVSNPVTMATFSPDGQRLALVPGDGTVRICAPETGLELLRLPRAGKVVALEFRPDGRQLAAANADGSVKTWSVETGSEGFNEATDLAQVVAITYSPDCQKLIAKGTNAVTVLAAESGRRLYAFRAPESQSVGEVDASGDRFACVNKKRDISVWDTRTSEEKAVFTTGGWYVHRLFFIPGGLGVITADQTLRIWDLNAKREAFVTSYRIYGGVANQEGSLFATFGGENTAAIWTLGERKPRLLKGHTDVVEGVALSPDGRLVATASRDGVVKVWSSRPGRDWLMGGSYFTAAAFSPDSKRLVSAHYNREGAIWDLETGRQLHLLRGHFNWMYGAAFSPDGRRVVTCGADRLTKVWDAATGRALLTLRGHASEVSSVAFSPDGHRLVTGSRDTTAKLWDVLSGQELFSLRGHTGGVCCVNFSPDGRRIASGSEDGTARLWSASDGQLQRTLSDDSKWAGPDSWIWSVAFSPDGNQVATVGFDRTVKLWAVETGRLLRTLRCRAPVQGLAFSPDGKRLATATSEHTSGLGYPSAEIWDIESGREVLSWSGHSGAGTALALSPDGRKVFTASTDSIGKVWESFPWREADYPGPPGQPLKERIKSYASDYWRQRLATEASAMEAESLRPTHASVPFDRSVWPVRDPQTDRRLLDLAPHYNVLLSSPWEPFALRPILEFDLASLPTGVVTLEGVAFDVRGAIQLCRNWPGYWTWFPTNVSGIAVNQKCRRLHCLQGTTYSEKEETPIGSYVLHFADGTIRELPILYGRDVRDWVLGSDQKTNASDAVVAWTETDPAARARHRILRLFKRTWENPLPDVEITTIDFVSKVTTCGPFLIAVTVE